MSKVLPGWDGMILFKDLHSHCNCFVGSRQKAEKELVLFLHWRHLCVSSPLQKFLLLLEYPKFQMELKYSSR